MMHLLCKLDPAIPFFPVNQPPCSERFGGLEVVALAAVIIVLVLILVDWIDD